LIVVEEVLRAPLEGDGGVEEVDAAGNPRRFREEARRPGRTPPEGPGVGDPLRYEVVMEDLILPEEYAGRGDAVAAMTQRFTATLEHIIRRAPEQYFWLHRRWKHQPRARKGKWAA
jgi:hypothetical protein